MNRPLEGINKALQSETLHEALALACMALLPIAALCRAQGLI